MPKQKTLKNQKLRNNEYYNTLEMFDSLHKKSADGEQFTNLVKLISCENNIRLAYRNIKNNSGSNTAGVDGKTIKYIEQLSEVEYVKLV